MASHFGGTRQGMAISWPGHIKDVGGIRTQFHHVIDIVPTILEATGIKAPEMVNGIKQKPIEGVSMAYTFDKANANAPSTRNTQYFEMVGNRGIYHEGWYAARRHSAAPWTFGDWQAARRERLQVGTLQYHRGLLARTTISRRSMPEKLKEMQALFLTEAAKYKVLPLDNRAFARLLDAATERDAGQTVFTYTGVESRHSRRQRAQHPGQGLHHHG